MADGKLVAIVDDDEAILVSMSGFVRSCGFAAVVFPCPARFLASPALFAAGCLITDVQTPGMDGFALCARLRILRPDLPVIMMTALDEQALARQARAADVAAFFVKPVASERLADCLTAIFGP